MKSRINTKEYWDNRFGTGDWEDKGGHEQTQYFYTLLLKYLPRSLKDIININNFTICDVGCAEGDGTNLLDINFPNAKVCGIDISEKAIIKAKNRYPNIDFKTKLDSKYNLIISSNTLEHFENPYEHLQNLFDFSKEYVVLLVPFEEYKRIDEHFFTFTYEYFKLQYDDFSMVFIKEIEADKRFWNGKQLLLVFQKNIDIKNLTLETMGIASLLSAREKIILENRDTIKNQEQIIKDKEQQLQAKEQQIQDTEQENIFLANKVVDLVEMVDSMRIKNRVKKIIKKAVPLNKYQLKEIIKKSIKLLVDEKNYMKLKNMYNQKQMDIISSHDKLIRKIDFEADKVLYVFPVIDWNFRMQRPQHLASQFRHAGYKVIYFNTTFHISKEPGYFLSEIEDGILSITLFLDENKNIYKDYLSQKNSKFILSSILKLEKDLFINKRISILDHPFWFDIADKLSGAFTIYDCMDYHEGFGDESKYLIELENKAMVNSDLLVLSSQDLYERFSKKNKNVVLVRNGCEFKYFNTKPQSVKVNEKKIIGYYGAISSWFDSELVIALAKHYLDYDFILIGGTHGCDNLQGLKAMDNIILVGEVPYQELTEYLYGFDVCIMPFKVNELTQATNPVKIYEYLASGKPVVSTLLPEVEMMSSVVYTANSTEEFINKIDLAMCEDSNQKQIERVNFSKSNDWMSRYNVIENKINEIKEIQPKVSIVVVTYNNLHFTKNCLESMERFNNYENCEIIIVDNLSNDGTREYLTEFAKSREDIKVILHDKNSGFAGGNNIGIKASSGDYIILLNNDTYVTPNWIKNLLRHFSDEKIAMVGPRTNNIGNEARIDIKYNSLDEMIQKSYDIYYKNVLNQYEMEVLAFFCVVIKRDIIDEIGLLDEVYGIGMFEDDDYCKRVKHAGYRLVCADDVFIHHHLGASFDKDLEWKQKLFEKNRTIFESRYGEWIPHKYRMESQ